MRDNMNRNWGRGNAGGGLAFLRVMSYLTPERIPVGYSVTPARAETKIQRTLATFGRVPSQSSTFVSGPMSSQR